MHERGAAGSRSASAGRVGRRHRAGVGSSVEERRGDVGRLDRLELHVGHPSRRPGMERHEEKLGQTTARVFRSHVRQRYRPERRLERRQSGRCPVVGVEVGGQRLARHRPGAPRVARQWIVAGDAADAVVERPPRRRGAPFPERRRHRIETARLRQRHLGAEGPEIGGQCPDEPVALALRCGRQRVGHRRAGGGAGRLGEERRQPIRRDAPADAGEVGPRLGRELLVGRGMAGGAAELADEDASGGRRRQMPGTVRRGSGEPFERRHDGRGVGRAADRGDGPGQHGDGGPQRRHGVGHGWERHGDQARTSVTTRAVRPAVIRCSTPLWR